jgi:hypothetical protein
MKAVVRNGVLAVLVFVSSPVGAQAPKPSADVRKLEVWVGTWNYEGDAKATPIGPAAKIAGTQTGRMVMGGFAFEWKGSEKGVMGAVEWGEMDTYDAAAKTYPFFGYQTDGTIWSGTNTIVGGVWKASASTTVKGVSYKVRGESTPSADGKSWTFKQDLSTDGKTWMPWTEVKMTKVQKPQS